MCAKKVELFRRWKLPAGLHPPSPGRPCPISVKPGPPLDPVGSPRVSDQVQVPSLPCARVKLWASISLSVKWGRYYQSGDRRLDQMVFLCVLMRVRVCVNPSFKRLRVDELPERCLWFSIRGLRQLS